MDTVGESPCMDPRADRPYELPDRLVEIVAERAPPARHPDVFVSTALKTTTLRVLTRRITASDGTGGRGAPGSSGRRGLVGRVQGTVGSDPQVPAVGVVATQEFRDRRVVGCDGPDADGAVQHQDGDGSSIRDQDAVSPSRTGRR